MLHGSGDSDRDGDGYFPPVREHLLRHGIAVLCYDKPGVGRSSGDWRRRNGYERADEALAAVRFLRDRGAISPEWVGLWGISQGGWIAPLAASISPAVAFLITVSGPGVTPAEQNAYDVETRMRADGWAEHHVGHAVAYVRALMRAAAADESYERVEETLLRRARGEPWYGYFELPDAEMWGFFSGEGKVDFDPEPVLERVSQPLLAVFGERDRLVPVARSVEVYERALTRGGNPDFTIEVFPGANHGIGIADRQTEPEHFAPGYLDLMAGWILERFGGAMSEGSGR